MFYCSLPDESYKFKTGPKVNCSLKMLIEYQKPKRDKYISGKPYK